MTTEEVKTDIPRSKWLWEFCGDERLNEVQLLFINHAMKEVLLYRDNDVYVLPGYLRTSGMTHCGTKVLVDAVRDHLNLTFRFAVLCAAWEDKKEFDVNNEVFDLQKCVMLIDCIEGCETFPPGYCWVPLQNATVYHLFPAATEAINAEIRCALLGEVPPLREPWAHPGWFEKAESWMDTKLKDLCAAKLHKPVTQYQTHSMGITVKGETDKGDFYLKCTNFSNDAGITEALSKVAPRYVRPPVVVDRSKKMMLTSDYGENIIGLADLKGEELAQAMKDFARLQQATIERTAELMEAGVPDRSPKRLVRDVEKVLWHPLLDLPDLADEDDQAEINRLRDSKEIIKKELRKLVTSKIPLTILHSDLFLSNIYVSRDDTEGGGSYKFFDWADAAVSHPFAEDFGLVQRSEREAYLEAWAECGKYGTIEELRDCYEATKLLTEIVEAARLLEEAETLEGFPRRETVGLAISSLGQCSLHLRGKGG